jgi:hypothetical protein
MAGAGAPFVCSASIAAALEWFPDKRGLASGSHHTRFLSIVGDWFGTRNATSNDSFMYSAKGVASVAAIVLRGVRLPKKPGAVPVGVLAGFEARTTPRRSDRSIGNRTDHAGTGATQAHSSSLR